MIRNLRRYGLYIPQRSFLTREYKCADAWNEQTTIPLSRKVNLGDFFNLLDQNHSSKGVISAIDVDLFANSVRDQTYLEELKDLLHKLRLSAETGNTLESTHHASIRNLMEFGNDEELIAILKDPLNFGIFLDDFTANILMDKLLTSHKYKLAAEVASLVMLQEDYSNDITCALSQYACYKHISTFEPKRDPEPEVSKGKPKKVEEIKIRVKFLRNPYFDDHFDIHDSYLLAGKTIAWMSEQKNTPLNYNLQLLGWLSYNKIYRLLPLCQEISKTESKVFPEVIDFISKRANDDDKALLDQCLSELCKLAQSETSLEEALKTNVENAINRIQNKDIERQQKSTLMESQMFKEWASLRMEKLEEQTKRLDRAKRIQAIKEKQDKLHEEEQKLWFFDNEDKIDLEIEEKEKLHDNSSIKKTVLKESDENYIPPEILPQRR